MAKKEQYYTIFDRIDPEWALSQAHDIQSRIPIFQKSNGSGKFFDTYWTYQFYRDSKHPLIEKFVTIVQEHQELFESIYERPLGINFIMLSYVEDSSKPMCIYHRDGYFWNGQMHLTILGEANILLRDQEEEFLIKPKNGTVWYLNGTSYMHRIKESSGERFELTAPINERPEDVQEKLKIVSDDAERWLDSSHPDWIKLRHRQVAYVKSAIAQNRASNSQVAAFNIEVGDAGSR